MALEDITAFIRLDDGTGLSGMPTADQCREVKQAGYERVVNLAPEDSPSALPAEPAIWAELGLDYTNIPVAWSNPTRADLDSFIAQMEQSRGRSVFVHCVANLRVTAFYAIYAVEKLGWPRDRALALIDRVWSRQPQYSQDPVWAAFIADNLRSRA